MTATLQELKKRARSLDLRICKDGQGNFVVVDNSTNAIVGYRLRNIEVFQGMTLEEVETWLDDLQEQETAAQTCLSEQEE